MDLPPHGRPSRIEVRAGAFGNILDECAIPYLALDSAGVIVRMNGPARDLLRNVGAVRHPSVFVASLAPRSISRFHRYLVRLFKSREPSSTTVSMRPASGRGVRSYRVDGSWVESGARQGYCLISLFDVTDQQKTEATLAATELRLRALLDLLPDPVVLLCDLRIQSANRAALEFFGVSVEADLVGRSLQEFVTDAYRSDVERRAQLVRGTRSETADVRIVDARGRQRVAEATWTRAPTEIGSEPTAMCVLRDVGEQRQLEAQLAHAERLRTLATLAAGVAHEVNNPLTYVLLALDEARVLVQRSAFGRDSDREQLADQLTEATEGTKRVREIVRDLSRFSRTDSDARSVDVNAAVRQAVQLATGELRYRAKLVTSLGQVRPGLAPEGRLVQVLLNLVLNAGQAIDEGDPTHNSVTVTTFERDKEILISVEDTGTGIPEPARAHIFEPFFTTKRPGEGTGLGLFVCHQYVHGWGGRIEVHSDGRSWTRFNLSVPLVPTTVAQASADASPAVVSSVGRVLAVDDEAVILRGVAGALASVVDEVVTVERAADALAKIEAGESFDLILCDLQMPEMSGPDLYEAIERINPELVSRIVFATGGACTSKARTFLERVGPPVLGKPFTRQELRTFVARWLAPDTLKIS